MVIIELKGGLGNQMFQYAAAITYANNRHQVFVDLGFLQEYHQSSSHFTARQFELNIFSKLSFKIGNKFLKKTFLLITKLEKILKRLSTNLKFTALIFDGHPAVHITSRFIYMTGYFQDPLIFEHKKKELIAYFTFPELPEKAKEVASLIMSSNAISIHVRRGDYVNPEINEFHGILTKTYYEEAVMEIKKELKETSFFVFSDDISWCVSNFSFISNDEINFVDLNEQNWVDMKLMTLCKHHIIANSSFSWWGAWLSANENQIVIAPKLWFRNEKTKIIPKQWKTI